MLAGPIDLVSEFVLARVSAERRGVNGGATSAVLVPKKSRTKDDDEDDYDGDWGDGEG